MNDSRAQKAVDTARLVDEKSFFHYAADNATIARSALNSFILQIVLKLKGIITTPLLTYYLTPSELGVLNLIVAASALLSPVFSLNLSDGPAVFFVQEKDPKKIVVMYNTAVNGAIVSCVALGCLCLTVTVIYSPTHLFFMALVLFVSFSGIMYKFSSYVLVVFQKTTVLVQNTFFKEILTLLSTVPLLYLGFSYTALIILYVFINIAAAISIRNVTRESLPYRLELDSKTLWRFLSLSLPLLPVFFFSWVTQSSSLYFLLLYCDQGEVGRYSVMLSIGNLVLTLTWALNLFWFPISSRLWIERKDQYHKLFKLIFKSLGYLLFVLVLFLELNCRLISSILIRSSEYGDSCVVLGVIAFAYAMQVLTTLLTAPLYAEKQVRSVFGAYLVGALANTCLNLLLIPEQGIWGAAVSMAAAYFVIVVTMGMSVYRMAFAFLEPRYLISSVIFGFAWIGFSYLRDYLNVPLLLTTDFSLLVLSVLAMVKVGYRVDEAPYLGRLLKEGFGSVLRRK